MTSDPTPDAIVPDPSAPGSRRGPSPEVIALADERARARSDHEWTRADELRVAIEAAGWKVVDRGTRFRLERAAPPDVVEGHVIRYGSSASVPSVLGEAPTAAFTVELLAADRPEDLARCISGLRSHAPAGTQVIVVANGPSGAQAERLEDGAPDLEPVGGLAVEVVHTSARLGHAAARNVGLRRALGEIVLLADTSIEPAGDVLTPLAEALSDPEVGVAGAFGTVSDDLRRFEDAPGPGVDVIDGCWLAFRREDIERLGPLDEKFAYSRHLDTWWSLVLRAGAEDDPPRRAVRVPLPLVRHADRDPAPLSEDERDRLSKRNFYRVLDRFRERKDLLLSSAKHDAGPSEEHG